ncbi:MAG: HipA domain-containing protein [Carboxylicivirga sp.]|nr:HipA domain-containing protein [Carboxylicivirga sp.]
MDSCWCFRRKLHLLATFSELSRNAANEHLTMRMAEAFGINVVSSSFIRLQTGEFSYITKRVDRTVQGNKT